MGWIGFRMWKMSRTAPVRLLQVERWGVLHRGEEHQKMTGFRAGGREDEQFDFGRVNFEVEEYKFRSHWCIELKLSHGLG